MIKIINLINEALPLSRAKELTRGWDNTTNQLWFGGKYRIYIPLVNTSRNLLSQTQQEVEIVLTKSGYLIKDYIDGIAINKKYDRLLKIGKILNKLDSDLLQKFNNDGIRQTSKTKNPLVVISRHPYDIAGMSTDRGWTSCKDLGTDPIYSDKAKKARPGMYSRFLSKEVNLLLIAYLIYPDDKNITHPIARVNIVPYQSTKDKSKLLFTVSDDAVYGFPGSLENIFIETVKQWVKDKQPDESGGPFKLSSAIYNDNQPTLIHNMTPDEWLDFEWLNGVWQNTTWVNGVWQNGIWKSGKWMNGVWYTGEWLDGIWKDGTWKSGVWQGGRWYNGHWENGTWQGGTWQTGTWEDGEWGEGYWKDGLWKGGIWLSGTWLDGIWQSGTWLSGTWLYGTWYEGTWEWGDWLGGVWENGTWLKGNWWNGKWKNGTWQDGDWFNGTWKDGIWIDGYWKGGVWLSGTWLDGIWQSGTWEKGTWKNGSWLTGTWLNGTWEDGDWFNGNWTNGVWKNGTWEKGWIYDIKLQGNFLPDWEWDDGYVLSTINPALYWKGKQ